MKCHPRRSGVKGATRSPSENGASATLDSSTLGAAGGKCAEWVTPSGTGSNSKKGQIMIDNSPRATAEEVDLLREFQQAAIELETCVLIDDRIANDSNYSFDRSPRAAELRDKMTSDALVRFNDARDAFLGQYS